MTIVHTNLGIILQINLLGEKMLDDFLNQAHTKNKIVVFTFDHFNTYTYNSSDSKPINQLAN